MSKKNLRISRSVQKSSSVQKCSKNGPKNAQKCAYVIYECPLSTAATSVATSVINAVNGALKGAAVSSANQASNNTPATSTQPSSVTPVNTVVTVTTTKS